MKTYSRCKVCGFITETDKIGEVCQACGVPKTAFEAYKPNINEKRKKILDIHAHPIILHFPQAFTLTALFLLAILPVFSGDLHNIIDSAAKVMMVLMPPAVIAGFATGLLDGKIRFKKVTTPILKRKIIMGSAYILFSLIIGIVVLVTPITGTAYFAEIIMLLICSGLAVVLGKVGSSLTDAKMPG